MPANETIRQGWSEPRDYIDTDDTLVSASATTMKQANIPAYSYKPNSKQNAIEIAFLMGVNAEVCAAFVFAAKPDGDIVRVWTGNITCGTMEDTDHTGHYVDTFDTTVDSWITTIKEVDGGGGNRMARLVFDTCGYSDFFVQFTGLGGVETAKVIYTGF